MSTVMFSAPEFSHGNIPGMSDIYSLGRLFLFMSTQKEIFYKLLFLPIESEEVLKKISSSLQKIEIISLVSKMTMFEPKERPKTEEIRQILQNCEPIDFVNSDLLLECGFPIDEVISSEITDIDE